MSESTDGMVPSCSGKSSLLKALSGRVATPKGLTGSVRYGGLTPAMAKASGVDVGQIVQYVSQIDEHVPSMTVREVRGGGIAYLELGVNTSPHFAFRQTLDFVARNCFPDPSGNGEVAKQRVQDIVELLHLGGEAGRLSFCPFWPSL